LFLSSTSAALFILQTACQQPKASWSALWETSILYCLYIGIGVCAIQQLTGEGVLFVNCCSSHLSLSHTPPLSGVNAMNFYAQDVLEDAGFSQDQAYYLSIYLGVVKVAFVAVAMLIVDKAGRRILLIVGIAGMTASTFVLAALFQVKHSHGRLSPGLGWTALISLFAYMAFYELSLG